MVLPSQSIGLTLTVVKRPQTYHKQLGEVTQNYNDVSKDLRREQVAGRHAQDEAEIWKKRFEELQSVVHHGSFVLVLVDADADSYMVSPHLHACAFHSSIADSHMLSFVESTIQASTGVVRQP
jgi:hypothetical protein